MTGGACMSEIKDKSEEQKAAEAEVESFRKDRGPFVVAADTTRMPMVFMDAREPGNPIIFANESFLTLTGYDREEVLGQSFNFLMARGANPEALAEIEAAFEGSSDSDPEIRYRRKDGSVFWASIYISPVRDEGGDVVQHFASFMDLTKHKQEKDRLRFLLDELNHRTQNTLATVQAIAVQTLRGGADKEVVDAFEGRILALSKAHTLLGRENWDGVGLRDIIDQILQPFGINDRRPARFSVEGGDVRMLSIRLVYLNGHSEDIDVNRSLRHGEEFDLDAVIEFAVERHAGFEADRIGFHRNVPAGNVRQVRHNQVVGFTGISGLAGLIPKGSIAQAVSCVE